MVATSKEGLREIAMMRWGFPPAGGGKRPVTNVRNLGSNYWRGWLEQPRFRCVVPATSFVEYTDTSRRWRTGSRSATTGRCSASPASGGHGPACAAKRKARTCCSRILTTEPNELTKPIHAEAMPVMLTGDEIDTWLEAPVQDAVKLAKPFPAERMKIVLSGPREDLGGEAA